MSDNTPHVPAPLSTHTTYNEKGHKCVTTYDSKSRPAVQITYDEQGRPNSVTHFTSVERIMGNPDKPQSKWKRIRNGVELQGDFDDRYAEDIPITK